MTMDIEKRLERLESQNRRLKLLGAAMAIGVVCVTAIGAQDQAPQKVEAKSFVLLDDAGKERATLGLFKRIVGGTVVQQGPTLSLLDSAGKRRVELSCIEEPAGSSSVTLELRGKDGSPQVYAFAMDDVNIQSSIGLNQPDGAKVRLSALPTRAEVSLGVKKGLGGDATEMFATSDSRGFRAYRVKPLGGGGGQEVPEISITHKGDKNSIVLSDKDGAPIWSQP
jgi:hypothetical protein